MENTTPQSAAAQQVSLIQVIKQSKGAKIGIIVIIIAILIGLWFATRSLFIAATVNGSAISRASVRAELEKQGGKDVVDGLITERLVKAELTKKDIKVTDEELAAEMKTIEDSLASQGQTLDAVLAAQGITRAELTERIETQVAVKKFLADKTMVTDAEVSKYITDSKMTIPKGKEAETRAEIKSQLESQKLNQEAGMWVASLKAAAKIKYYVDYK